MIFNDHWRLKGKHATISASNYFWTRDDDERFIKRIRNAKAAALGERKHKFAAEAIELGERLRDSTKAINQYVNDAIGFKMRTEVPLFYSDNCFGTADAICFRRRTLRIHDLKTGMSSGCMTQLMIYAALFCLEYKHKPKDITVILRIYHGTEYTELIPEPQEVEKIMKLIIHRDRLIFQENKILDDDEEVNVEDELLDRL